MTGVVQDLWSLVLLAVFSAGWKLGRAELRHHDAERDAVDEMAERDRQGPYWQRGRR